MDNALLLSVDGTIAVFGSFQIMLKRKKAFDVSKAAERCKSVMGRGGDGC